MAMQRRSLLTSALGLGAALPVLAKSSASVAGNTQWDLEADIVIIGSGGAGFAAAVSAAEQGAKVLVLEKNAFIGGNTIASGGAINAVVPGTEKQTGKKDSEELFYEQTLLCGGFRGRPELVKVLTSHSLETYEWLKKNGVEFIDYVYQVYGGLFPRTRNPKLQGGQSYIKALSSVARKLGVTVRTNTKVLEFVREQPFSGRVLGVVAEGKEGKLRIHARRAVIAAAGGFAANAKMCGLHDPRLEPLGTSNLPSATGEVLRGMINIGAETVGMDYIQCVINKPSDMPKYVPMSIFVDRFIMVNWEGHRFVAEDAPRNILTDAFLAQTRQQAFSVVDAEGYRVHRTVGRVEALFDEALQTGLMHKGETLAELAGAMKVPAEALEASVRQYNEAVSKKKDPLGRDVSMLQYKIERGPFYAVRYAMARHHTMGGALINSQAQVIDREGKPIPGLYAAGEVTGGVHGNNRVGGNAILDIFTFGRIAGNSAVNA